MKQSIRCARQINRGSDIHWQRTNLYVDCCTGKAKIYTVLLVRLQITHKELSQRYAGATSTNTIGGSSVLQLVREHILFLPNP